MKNVQPPQLLTDLYRDLRDRRLLVPVLALAVALIAVPIALSSSASPTQPAPAAPAANQSLEDAAPVPAVLTRELGVTEYRKRLQNLQSKNPFRQQFTVPEVTSKVEQSSVTEPVGGTSGVSTAGGGSTSTSSTTEPTSTSSISPDSGTSTSTSTEPSGGARKPRLYVFQLDLAIGPPGDLSRRKHVELGKFLPSQAKPMFAFAGVTQDMKRALFLVSDDVSSVDGDGRCFPGPGNCRLLRLKVGHETKLAYAPEGDRTYKLRLHGIDIVPFDGKASNKRGKRGYGLGSEFALAASR